MRDKSSFDDLEMPEVSTTPIDGMTDEQWAARNERQGRIIRRVCAVAVGLASWFVIVGAVLYFVGIFERGDDT
jgi:hypothetical protein